MSKQHSTPYSVYAVVGQDRFLRNEAMAELLRAVHDGGDDALGPTRMEGDQAELADVLDEVRTLSLLGDRRIVVVDDADGFISANRKLLEEYCSSPVDTGILILICNTLPRNTRLHRIIAENGQVVVCEAPRGRAITSWITRRAQSEYGKSVGIPAAAALREHTGDSPGALDAELAKLTAYVGSRDEITPADVDALVGLHREEKVFAVTDAMSAGDAAKALASWEQVLATDRAAPGRAIAGLAWGVRRLLEARRDLDKGVPVSVLARRTYTDPDVIHRRLSRVTTRQLEDQLSDLAAADHAVKTGLGALGRSVERFIVKHSQQS
jgi:DNA polymerase-3 subunit delta